MGVFQPYTVQSFPKLFVGDRDYTVHDQLYVTGYRDVFDVTRHLWIFLRSDKITLTDSSCNTGVVTGSVMEMLLWCRCS